MAKKSLQIQAPARPAPRADAPTPVYELSTTTLDATSTSAVLPPEADALSDPLRELAVRFIGARRRVGEALLEACRYMNEARLMAEEGQWYLFLRATGTSPDSAEALINIHLRAGQHPTFAEQIRSGRLNQTVAGELAKPSTPPEVFSQLLEREEPLRVADVKRARRIAISDRDMYHNAVDNPNNSGSIGGGATTDHSTQTVLSAEQVSLSNLLDEVAITLEAIVSQVDTLQTDERTAKVLDRIEQAMAAIRHHNGGTA